MALAFNRHVRRLIRDANAKARTLPAPDGDGASPPVGRPSDATLLKEWEARHNAGVQFQAQFMTLGTIIATAMTAGLAYVMNIEPAHRQVYPLASLSCVAGAFTLGCVIAQGTVGRYRRRLNTLAKELSFPEQNELGALQVSLWVGAACGLVFISVTAGALADARQGEEPSHPGSPDPRLVQPGLRPR